MYQVFKGTFIYLKSAAKGWRNFTPSLIFFKKKKDPIDQMIATNNGETVYVAYNWI